ncbi:MAG TPA: hypothetical protein VHQ64_11025, partial [Pyrinomonadaceae bacterium]|nr:hypothetical protein [Pyrinomonadaceae bacterium]
MLPQAKLLLAIVVLVFTVAGNATAQAGRLFGTVLYSDSRAYAARGARVIAVGAYFRTETRTDGNGNFGLVLPAGTYQIYGQGVYPYTQRVNVYGYVRAGADTVISPN